MGKLNISPTIHCRIWYVFGFMAIGFILGEMGFSGSTMTWYIASAVGCITRGFYCFTRYLIRHLKRAPAFSLRDGFMFRS